MPLPHCPAIVQCADTAYVYDKTYSLGQEHRIHLSYDCAVLGQFAIIHLSIEIRAVHQSQPHLHVLAALAQMVQVVVIPDQVVSLIVYRASLMAPQRLVLFKVSRNVAVESGVVIRVVGREIGRQELLQVHLDEARSFGHNYYQTKRPLRRSYYVSIIKLALISQLGRMQKTSTSAQKEKQKELQQLSSIFNQIGSNLSNFYSSRPKSPTSHRSCSCLTAQLNTRDELSFYSSQAQMISKSSHILSQPERTEEERIFAQLLIMSLGYIEQIKELLGRKVLCSCKEKALAEIPSMRQKIGFMRDQNEKFFRLYEQKSRECEDLRVALRLMELEHQENKGRKAKEDLALSVATDMGLVPVSNINKPKPPMPSSSEALFPASINVTSQTSVDSSKISECLGTEYLRENMRLTPQKKTLPCQSRMEKKSKIFGEKSVLQSHLY